MKRFAVPLLVAATTMVGVMSTASQPAEARSGRYAAGIVFGAVVGLVAREVYRRERRRSYVYYAPRPYYGHGYSYGYSRHYRHGW
jgi:hypothetical protein